MSESLRMLGLLFYAPARGVRLAAARGRFLTPILFALLTQAIFMLVFYGKPSQILLTQPPVPVPAVRSVVMSWTLVGIGSLFSSSVVLSIIGLIFIPVVIFLTARSAGRIGISAALQRDYARVTPAVFCAYGLANLWTGLLSSAFRLSGGLARLVEATLPALEEALAQNKTAAATLAPAAHRPFLAMYWVFLFSLPVIAAVLWWSVRIVFKISVARSFLISAAGCAATAGLLLMLTDLRGALVAAPILVAMSFLVLRASFLATLERQRDVAAFEQAVLAADRSPHDARAQYDLGLIMLERGEVAQAAARFEQASARDPEDHDTQFQLGRIARMQGRWADAIKHFEPVVANDFAHAHYEIWREVGATYLGAGQFADAVQALERFLDHRPDDAEGWCLLGQAQAGLGNAIEATAAMHACLSATEGLKGEEAAPFREWRSRAEEFLRRAGK